MTNLKAFLYIVVFILTLNTTSAQVLNPNDPLIEYDANNPPSEPAWGQIGKWVRTDRLSWDTDEYKAYLYKYMPFRIMWPKNYDPNKPGGYPMVIMLHGRGETAWRTDNEYQLLHGGQKHRDAVRSGAFEGFVMFPQTSGAWNDEYYDYLYELLNKMHDENEINLDLNRISVHGLSMGGGATWRIFRKYPEMFAGILPMSGTNNDWSGIDLIKYTPIWQFQGGLDSNPKPGVSLNLLNLIWDAGGNAKFTVYENMGHGVWNTAYNESDFFPFMMRANKVNPWILHERSEFCPGDNINVQIGVTPGFDGYQWRKDGVIISGASSNEITATTPGIYDVRIKRGTEWSYWSPQPVEIKIKEPTVTPPIIASEGFSPVIPAPDGRDYVQLELPEGYESYEWRLKNSSTVLSTERTYSTSNPGEYVAKVTEFFGCSSNFSEPYTVINSNGANKPETPGNLLAFTLSKTEIELSWSDNPNALYNETGFEIYRRKSPADNFQLVFTTEADANAFIDTDLSPEQQYFYIIRAINENGGSGVSNVATATTIADDTAPSAPGNLKVESSSPSEIRLTWDASYDDVGIKFYEVYKNGFKAVVTQETEAKVYNLIKDQVYNFQVIAIDFAGNKSPLSNQVTTASVFTGLTYKYYEGEWNALPDFNSLTPVKEGKADNFDISLRNRNDNFGFLFEGFINIPVTGSYTFETYSDDGSKLYIGEYDHNATPVVNNDGLHGNQYRQGTVYLEQGAHPIAVTFFEKGGGENLQVFWKNTAHGVGSRQPIPDEAFSSDFEFPGLPPEVPTNLVAAAASYNSINLTWNDNSNNETGFEISRAVSNSGPYTTIHTTESNVTNYTDEGLDAATTYYYKVQAIGRYGESGFEMTTSGVDYEYFQVNGMNKLPDFNALTPEETGTINTFNLSPRLRNDNFAFKFSSKIIINTAGEYTFYTKSDDGSKLYIGSFDEGDLIVNNDYLQGPTERSGTVYLSPGVHPIYVTFFERTGGEFLEVSYAGPGVSKQIIPAAVLGEPQANATTFDLPPVPDAPTDLNVTSNISGKITIAWSDNGSNEKGFYVYRSVNNPGDFKQIKNLPANATEFIDQNLYANVDYFYLIKAYNDGGISSSDTLAVRSHNTPPQLGGVEDIVARYDATTEINIFGSDSDNEALSFGADNLPVFASLNDYQDGTALLTLNPSEAEQGIYENIIIYVEDENGGRDADTIRIVVNDNYAPALSNVPHLEVNEGDSLLVTVTVTDQNLSDTIQWEYKGLPDFVTVEEVNNREVNLIIAPYFTDAYEYQNIKLKVSDGNFGKDEIIFSIKVNDVDPNQIVLVNFTGATNAPNPWNNVTGLTSSNLKDYQGNTSPIGLNFNTTWWRSFTDGAITGDNSGIFPDNVIKEYYYFGIFGGPNQVSVDVTGLDPSRDYKFTFFASSKWTGAADNGETVFTIDDQSVSIDVQHNTQEVGVIPNVVPDQNGVVTFIMNKGANTPVGYLNALVIESVIEEAPAAPNYVTANYDNKRVVIEWNDAPFNEDAFNIYRSLDSLSGYSLIKTLNSNIEEYVDDSIQSNATYFYKIKAINEYGESDFSNIASATIPAIAPSIAPIEPIVVSAETLLERQINLANVPNGNVIFEAVNLPDFVTLVNNGDSTATLILEPQLSDVGNYNDIEITATDSFGMGSIVFNIQVAPKKTESVLISFSKDYVAPYPWNSTAKVPVKDDFFGNLINDAGENTNVSVKLMTNIGGVMDRGEITGNNSGIIPDNALREYYWFGVYGSPNSARLEVSGLNPSAVYGFKFVGSSNFTGNGITDNGETDYTIGDQTVSLKVHRNTSDYAEILNVTPNQEGKVYIFIEKGEGAQIGYINALIIDEYKVSDEPGESKPISLIAESYSKTSIKLNWQDEVGESGYELYRASEKDGEYELIAALSPNVTEYTDSGLPKHTRYYYKLKTLIGSSELISNVATSSTLLYSVYANFNGHPNYNAAIPWNNFGSLPVDGDVYAEFRNDSGEPTGILFSFEKSLTGSNDWGMSTGNNSGVAPDNVLKSFFFMESFEEAKINISGLDQSMRYNLGFISSIAMNFSVTTEFTVGNSQVVTEGQNNTSEIRKITNLVPNDNNELIIDITSAGQWSILNGLVVEVFPAEGVAGSRFAYRNTLPEHYKKVQYGNEEGYPLAVYPNPFKDRLTIDLGSKGEDVVRVAFIDLNGHTIIERLITDDLQANRMVNLDAEIRHLKNGFYILQAEFESGKLQYFKLFKN